MKEATLSFIPVKGEAKQTFFQLSTKAGPEEELSEMLWHHPVKKLLQVHTYGKEVNKHLMRFACVYFIEIRDSLKINLAWIVSMLIVPCAR